MKKILITGASGLLGKHFIHAFSKFYDITAICFARPAYYENEVKWLKLDLRDKQSLRALKSIKYDYILHLAAMTHPEECEKYKEESFNINVEITKMITELAIQQKSKLIFTSTDLVFDGDNAKYSEEDEINPRSYYAEHKALGEEYIRFHYPGSLVLRLSVQLSKVFEQGFYFDIMNRLKNKEALNVFSDEYRSFTFASYTVRVMQQLINQSGLYHLAMEGGCSRSELTYDMANKYQLDSAMIKEISKSSMLFKAFRPKDTRLKLDKLRAALHEEVPLLKDEI